MGLALEQIPGPDPGACPDCGGWRKAGMLHSCAPVSLPAIPEEALDRMPGREAGLPGDGQERPQRPTCEPDLKPEAPVVDRDARKRARLLSDECAACGHSDRVLSVHHVMGAEGHGRRRDDDPRNLLVLCGDGVAHCHGGFHAGDEQTRRKIGRAILRRPKIVEYVKERLGDEQAREYLARRYLINREEIS